MRVVLFTKREAVYSPVVSVFKDLVEDLRIIYPEDQPRASEDGFKEFKRGVSEFNPDAIVSFLYSRYIPSSIFSLAKHSLNYHPSLLPDYAGAHALNWQIVNGEKRSGVTVHKLSKEIDGGEIVIQKPFDIKFSDDINAVLKSAVLISSSLTVDLIRQLRNDSIEYFPQCQREGSFKCRLRKPEDGELNAGMTSLNMYNTIRALADPWPGATFKGSKGTYHFKNITPLDQVKDIVSRLS